MGTPPCTQAERLTTEPDAVTMPAMANPRIVAVGEVLWDLLPAGRVMGGAPANFICHARSLGADAALISRVGRDELGSEILERFAARGLPVETVQVDPSAPTGTVQVDVDAAGQPRFTIAEAVAWDRIEADEPARRAASGADAFCFGSLVQRTEPARRAVAELLACVRPDALRVCDINLRPPFHTRAVIESSLAAANMLKLNDQELPVLAGMFALSGDVRRQLAALADRFALKAVALTRGSQGSLLLADGKWSEHAGVRVTVRDAVGAGDAFTAAWVVGLLRGTDLDAVNARANEVAGYVCTQAGATPPLPTHLCWFHR